MHYINIIWWEKQFNFHVICCGKEDYFIVLHVDDEGRHEGSKECNNCGQKSEVCCKLWHIVEKYDSLKMFEVLNGNQNEWYVEKNTKEKMDKARLLDK